MDASKMAEYGMKTFAFVSAMAAKIAPRIADGKITLREVVDTVEDICEFFGIDLDKTGWTISRNEVQ